MCLSRFSVIHFYFHNMEQDWTTLAVACSSVFIYTRTE